MRITISLLLMLGCALWAGCIRIVKMDTKTPPFNQQRIQLDTLKGVELPSEPR